MSGSYWARLAKVPAAIAAGMQGEGRFLPFQPVLDAIHQLRNEVIAMSDTIQAEIQQLVQNVQRLTDANASAEALLKGLHDQLDAAISNAQSQGVDPAQLQQLNDLNSQIAARTAELAQAVTANTAASTGQSTQTSGAAGATGGNGGGQTGTTGDTGSAPSS